MEGRASRGRGGGWRRGGGGRGGGGGGSDSSESFGGEHRGRGRGGHHRGRGKRDHYRGRGRGGGGHGHAWELNHRDQNEGDNFQEEDDRTEVFSRRKLESNWDRYKESEKKEPDDDTPTHRGAGLPRPAGVSSRDSARRQKGASCLPLLLDPRHFPYTQAIRGQLQMAPSVPPEGQSVCGIMQEDKKWDSFTQFRFSEEKDWEMDSSVAGQMSAAFVDLPALAQSLQQVPLHQRLNLEAELVQVSTPVELPTMTLAPKQELPKATTFTPPTAALKVLGTNQKVSVLVPKPQVSSSAAETPADDVDEELDQLLSLQKPVLGVSGEQSVGVTDEESAVPEKACEEVMEAIEEKMEEVKDKDVAPPESVSTKKEVTEEDLEDWLDSMIS
ncbi:Cell death regulator [Collichthys lucidus]|uniref:Cell death regulator n=1 Tax=Collichthys lucidus TaxID=240159 RepID=A0A4U5URU6_COLLU|nr:Cell death regulator [Collichthys lucidus]